MEKTLFSIVKDENLKQAVLDCIGTYFDLIRNNRNAQRGKPWKIIEKENSQKQLLPFSLFENPAFLNSDEFYVFQNDYHNELSVASPDEFLFYLKKMDEGDLFLYHPYLVDKNFQWCISFVFDGKHIYAYGDFRMGR